MRQHVLILSELSWPANRTKVLVVRYLFDIAVLPGLAAMLALGVAVHAQELEPRAYSAAPVGTNFLLANITHLSGEVLTDPSVPITDVQANVNLATFGYSHTFGIAGHSASVAMLMPFAHENVSGNVFDAPREVQRGGPGDLRLRVAAGLLGAPALSPAEFARRRPAASLGASLTAIAPTGQYLPSRLINIGSNRWAFKPEIGISQPLGKWFLEGTAGVWLFSENDAFLGGQRRKQNPLRVFQLHAGYNFRPGLWLAADAGSYTGGATEVNGIARQDRQDNRRYGLTLSLPLGSSGWSGRFGWSKGWVTRAGGDYEGVAVTLQYRWFSD